MAIPYTTGPVHIYVQPPQLTPLYLGTMLDAPKVSFTPKWSPLMNDLAGDQEPYDMAYQGQSADIFGDLTVYNWDVLLIAKTRPGLSNDIEGIDNNLDIGTLMITEGVAPQIYVDYPYYRRKAAYSGAFAPAGYHFFAGWLIGPEEENPGTKPNMIHVRLHCMRRPDLQGNFNLYDHNVVPPCPNLPPTSAQGF